MSDDVELSHGHITADGIAELEKRIGGELRVLQFNTEVHPDAIRRFTQGTGDLNPLWRDPAYGEWTHFGAILAPPSFLYSVVSPSGSLAGGLPGVHSMLVGIDWTFARRLRLGDRIHPVARLSDVETLADRGDGPPRIKVTVDVEYLDQDDRLVASATAISYRIERPVRLAAGDTDPAAFSPAEMAELEERQMLRPRRGSEIRYVQDVQVGDPIASVTKGPLAFGDVESFISASRRVRSLGDGALYAQRHPADTYRDETNWPQPLWHICLRDSVARACGFPRAHDAEGQRPCWLTQMVCDWMGDDGFLESLSVRLLAPNYHGDLTVCEGTVREIKGDLVHCDVWCENHRGQRTAAGTASVRLLSLDVDVPLRARPDHSVNGER
jgi:acyl dehydratase